MNNKRKISDLSEKNFDEYISEDSPAEIFQLTFRLCKGVTFHKDNKLVQINSAAKNNTIFYREGPNNSGQLKLFSVDYEAEINLEQLKDIISSKMTASDKEICGKDYVLLLVDEDTTKSINISKEKSKSATYLQPTKELTDQIDLLPYLNYLFCFIEKKKADACSISVGGTSNSPIAILAHTISLLKAAESEKIAFSSLTHIKPLDKCFNGIKFASAKGGYLGPKLKKEAVEAIIESAGLIDKVYGPNSKINVCVVDFMNKIKQNIKEGILLNNNNLKYNASYY